MRSLLGGIKLAVIAVFIALCGVLLPVRAANTDNFTISSFEADYYLKREEDKTSTVTVKEKIVAQFPNFDQNHGILRAIPKTYQNHDVELHITSIADGSGKNWDYDADSENGNTVLKIGDADKFVQGTQTYVIEYTMRGVTLNLDDHEEFYWDINGNQWAQQFDSVVARVHLPNDIAANILQDNRCFTGTAESTIQNCTVSRADNTIAFTSTERLAPYETMTVVLGFTKDTFAPYHLSMSTIMGIIAAIVGLAILPPLIFLIVVLRLWRKFGRDAKSRGVIVPQYIPPKELSVIGSGVVLNQQFEAKYISAQILDLAVTHHIKIYETKQKKILKDKVSYELELTDTKNLSEDAAKVVTMLFGISAKIGDKVAIESFSRTLYQEASRLGSAVRKKIVQEGYFTRDPQTIRTGYIVAGVVFIVPSIVVFAIGTEQTISVMAFFMSAGVGLFLMSIVSFIAAAILPARTQKGVDMRDYLLGLKDYMQLAEAERIKVLQSPQGGLTEKVQVDPKDPKQLIKLYEKLLPYAMLFGIEEEWAKQFAELYKEQPDWYSGSGSFNAIYFATAMHSFNTASTQSFAPPSSSSSSGFSGGAGGGGGGGGGGGW